MLFIRMSLSFLLLTLITNVSFAQKTSPLPDLMNLDFTSSESKVLPGKSTERDPDGKILDEDQIGNLGIVSLFYQNACYTDGRYNHNNFKVEKGTVKDKAGKLAFDAYKCYAPTSKATQFLASQHCVALQFPTKEDYSLYQLNGSKIDKIAQIKASQIKTGKFTKIPEFTLSNLADPVVVFMVPDKQKITAYTTLSPTSEGARVSQSSLGNVLKYRYDVKGLPEDNIFGIRRQYYPVKEGNKAAIVWQDSKDKQVYLTRLSEDFKTQQTVTLLTNENKAVLAAATLGRDGNYYYVMIEESESGDQVILYKNDNTGKVLLKKQQYASKSSMDFYDYSNYMGALEYNDGKLLLMIARRLYKSSDGLNHQSGSAFLFDANNLNLLKTFGQTSGHSFDNFLTKNEKGEFVGIDLGDNYPRGVHLHKFSGDKRTSRIVYSFKTQHGESPKNMAGKAFPAYPEISSGGKQFYKWSNDNATYTELGGLVKVKDGYMVIFAGEPDSQGKAINNARANSDDPKNIGFVKVREDFENSSYMGNGVKDDLVLSKGITESGGFFTFGGSWSEQRNAGLVWLTKYRDKNVETAEHVKTALLSDGNILIIWQTKADREYQNTYAMKIDANGKILTNPVALGAHVRLYRRDDVLALGNKVLVVNGNPAEQKLEVLVLDF